MRSALGLMLMVALTTAVGLALVARTDDRDVAFSRGVPPSNPVVDIPPGLEACQGPVATPEAFDQLEVFVDPRGQLLTVLLVSIRDAATGAQLSRGDAVVDLIRPSRQRVDLERSVPGGRQVEVCLGSAEEQPVLLYGAEGNYDPEATLRVGEGSVPADLYLGFAVDEPPSALAQVPQMFDRASLWPPEPIGAWTYWLLLGLVAVAVPVLLGWGLFSAARRS